MDVSKIRRTILRELDRQGMTRTELADRAGITQANMSNYLNEKRELRSDTLERICEVLRLELKRKGR